MPSERAQDIHAFKHFIDQQLSTDPLPTVDQVIARWAGETQSDEPATTVQSLVADTEKTVEEIRKKFGFTTDARSLQSNPEAWSKQLQVWVDSQPRRCGPGTMDDSRESIYAGRGE